jgi:regulatory protein YycI of two-component signal transduction system YycFG
MVTPSNKWKTTAIVFIILFILETVFLAYCFNVGNETINNDVKCSNEICYNLDSNSYTYDSYNSLCKCYDSKSEVIHQEYIK